jgi:hypothetical protein
VICRCQRQSQQKSRCERSLAPDLIEFIHFSDHLARRLAGVHSVLRVVHERVPKCHARVAHVFVDDFTMLQDDFAEQTEQFVDELGEIDGAEVLGIEVKFRTLQNSLSNLD